MKDFRSATTIAREAITPWLRAKKRAARRKAVMEYAAEMAGTRFDLDPDLESTAIEELTRKSGARCTRPGKPAAGRWSR